MSPALVFIASAAGYLALWILAPLDFDFEGNIGAVVLLVAYSSLFLLGAATGFRRFRPSMVKVTLDVERLRRLTRVVACLGIIGLTLRIVERVVMRAGGGVTTDFTVNRDLIADGGSGPLAFAGALMATVLILLPLFVYLSRLVAGRRKLDQAYLAVSMLYPMFDLVLQGSRSTLVIFIGVWWVASYTTRTARAKPLRTLIGVMAILLVVWGSGQVFWIRTIQMGLDPVQSMYTSGYAQFAPPSDTVLSLLRSRGASGLAGLLYAYVHFCQYLLHGVYEFLYVAANVSSPSTWGMQTFYIPVKAVMSVMDAGTPEVFVQSKVLRSGIYTTLFGPIIYDFGAWGGMVVSTLFGFCTGGIARSVSRGRVEWLPMHAAVTGVLPFAFVVNWYTSGTGQFMVIGASLLTFLMRMKRFRIVSSSNKA